MMNTTEDYRSIHSMDVTIVDAMTDPGLFGDQFDGDS